MSYEVQGDDMKRIGTQLRILREGANLSQRQAAAIGGVTGALFSLVENGDRNPTLDTLEKMAGAVGGTLYVQIIKGGSNGRRKTPTALTVAAANVVEDVAPLDVSRMTDEERGFLTDLIGLAMRIKDPTERSMLLSRVGEAATRDSIRRL